MKQKTDLPIGIFDSGLGGLTVLKEIQDQLPNENLVYFGDTARVPYGSKSKEVVQKYSMQIARFLEQKKVKMIVVACNTASSVALALLRKKIKLPIFGVVLPGAMSALEKTRNGKIAVIGTEATIKSESYQKMLKNLSKRKLMIYARPCPLFVPLVEEGWLSNKTAQEAAKTYLKGIKRTGIDTLILGCTHYPLLKDLIKKIIGQRISIIDSASACAKQTHKVLVEHGLLNLSQAKGDTVFYVTDGPEKFAHSAKKFLGNKVNNVKLVKIER